MSLNPGNFELVTIGGRDDLLIASGLVDRTIVFPGQPTLLPAAVFHSGFELHPDQSVIIVKERHIVPSDVYISVIEDAVVSPRGAVFSNGSLVIESVYPWDKSNYMDQFGYDVESYRNQFEQSQSLNCESVDSAFFVREGGDSGYFHFVNSILPRIALFRRLDFPQMRPILLTPRKSFSSFFQSINMTDFIADGKWLRVGRLYFPSPLTYEGNHFSRNPSSTSLINEVISRKSIGQRDRIYLSRRDTLFRKIINETELERVLVGRGFRCISIDDMDFIDQIALFQNVEILVSAHGAGLANMQFMNPGGHVVEILSGNRVWPTFRTQAFRCGHQYSAVLSDIVDEMQTTERGQGNEDFRCDVTAVETVVNGVLTSFS